MTRGKAEEFKEVLGRYVKEGSGFYGRLCKVYDALSEVQDISEKARATPDSKEFPHGITAIVLREEIPAGLAADLEDSVQYNGRPHDMNDDDIGRVMYRKRELDGALIIDKNEIIAHAGVGLSMNIPEYKRRHGIKGNINDFMGFDVSMEDPVGMRNRSALYASDRDGDALAIFTFGESGEINLYYRGDRIYSSAGREMNWKMAKNGRPKIEYKDNVVHLPVCQQGETRSSYERPIAAAGPL
jgi:hypothetical protein